MCFLVAKFARVVFSQETFFDALKLMEGNKLYFLVENVLKYLHTYEGLFLVYGLFWLEM